MARENYAAMPPVKVAANLRPAARSGGESGSIRDYYLPTAWIPAGKLFFRGARTSRDEPAAPAARARERETQRRGDCRNRRDERACRLAWHGDEHGHEVACASAQRGAKQRKPNLSGAPSTVCARSPRPWCYPMQQATYAALPLRSPETAASASLAHALDGDAIRFVARTEERCAQQQARRDELLSLIHI